MHYYQDITEQQPVSACSAVNEYQLLAWIRKHRDEFFANVMPVTVLVPCSDAHDDTALYYTPGTNARSAGILQYHQPRWWHRVTANGYADLCDIVNNLRQRLQDPPPCQHIAYVLGPRVILRGRTMRSALPVFADKVRCDMSRNEPAQKYRQHRAWEDAYVADSVSVEAVVRMRAAAVPHHGPIFAQDTHDGVAATQWVLKALDADSPEWAGDA